MRDVSTKRIPGETVLMAFQKLLLQAHPLWEFKPIAEKLGDIAIERVDVLHKTTAAEKSMFRNRTISCSHYIKNHACLLYPQNH
jgi:hypothetical protein